MPKKISAGQEKPVGAPVAETEKNMSEKGILNEHMICTKSLYLREPVGAVDGGFVGFGTGSGTG